MPTLAKMTPALLGPLLAPQLLTQAKEAANNEDPYWRSRRGMPISQNNDFALLSGNSNPKLAKRIAERLGANLASGEVKKFADGEVRCEFDDEAVSGKHCYII